MRQIISSIIITLFLLCFLPAEHVQCQYIKANVSTKLEKLHQDRRSELQELDQMIKEYIESNQWTDDNYPINDFTVSITIAIDNVQSTFEEVYSARFHIFSTTGFQDVDKQWRFPYTRNQPMLFDPNIFDGLTGLIDFYMNIIVGEELDKYEQYGGSPYFSRALQICHLGKSDRYNRWWDKREQYVQRYLRESHKPFRDMTSWFYAAQYWTDEGNADEARTAAEETISFLDKVIQNTYEQEFKVEFFRREYKNVAAVFSQFDDLYAKIMEIDPERKDFYINFVR